MSLNPSDLQHADYIDSPVLQAGPIRPDSNLFPRALLFGFVGAILGALAYALFIGITGIALGYLAIGVAFLVAKAMTLGSRERGGRKYQIAAVVLTYLAVAAAHAMLVCWDVRTQTPITGRVVLFATKYGLGFPVQALQRSTINGAIGLLILFIGLRAAWRMTSGLPGAVQHPFSR